MQKKYENNNPQDFFLHDDHSEIFLGSPAINVPIETLGYLYIKYLAQEESISVITCWLDCLDTLATFRFVKLHSWNYFLYINSTTK